MTPRSARSILQSVTSSPCLRTGRIVVFFLLVGGCALKNEVVVYPLMTNPPRRPFSTLLSSVEAGDYARAVTFIETSAGKSLRAAEESAALGKTELVAGRYEAANAHLQEALAREPSRQKLALIAFDLSQTAYLTDRFADARKWALVATDYGLPIRSWYLAFLDALAGASALTIEGAATETPFDFGSPDIPRIQVKVNGKRDVAAIIDTAAVLTIISEKLASDLSIRKLGEFNGIFVGLIGEPIRVTFGLVDSIRIGGMEARNVPVAIMPDEKLSFFVVEKRPFKMDLLLGMNLLRRFKLDLRFTRRTLSMTPIERNDAMVDDPNLFLVDFRPVVPASIHGRGSYPFLLDTGSEVTFLNRSTLSDTSARGAKTVHGATLQGLGGARKYGEKIGAVELGVAGWGATYETLPLYEHDSSAFGIVGQSFLKHFRVLIDFGRMRLDLLQEE